MKTRGLHAGVLTDHFVRDGMRALRAFSLVSCRKFVFDLLDESFRGEIGKRLSPPPVTSSAGSSNAGLFREGQYVVHCHPQSFRIYQDNTRIRHLVNYATKVNHERYRGSLPVIIDS